MIDDLLKSHIEWLRGDHELCNPFLADRIEALEARGKKAEAERADLLEALVAMRDHGGEDWVIDKARAAIARTKTHSQEDGGPAFPNSVQPDFQWAESGMSLRDWFAGQALAALIAHYEGQDGSMDGIPIDAFQYADAMIEQRKGKGEKR